MADSDDNDEPMSDSLTIVSFGLADLTPDRILSSRALAALSEFNAEKDEHQARFEKLRAEAESHGPLSIEAFTEDWNESQFWVRRYPVRLMVGTLLRAL